MKRATSRHRRFQLSMQAYVCLRWADTNRQTVNIHEVFGGIREYRAIAGWRRQFRV